MIHILKILIREDVLTFILGLSLFIFSFATIINISATEQLFQEEVFPINVYTKGDVDTPFFLGVIMKEGSENAIVLVNQWENTDNQSDFLISFSQPVQNIELALQKKAGADERTRILEFAQRRHVPYSKIAPELNISEISELYINPQNFSHFYGVECNVPGIVRRVSSFQKTVSIPLKINPDQNINGYRPVRNIIVQVVPPTDYTVQNAMPEAQMFSLIGDYFSANEFAIDTTQTDLYVLYENRFIERDNRILEIILGMIISLATYFIASGFIKMIAPLHVSTFQSDDEKKGVMLVNQGRRNLEFIRRPRMK